MPLGIGKILRSLKLQAPALLATH